ncbi:hypothetical protein [Streptomyces telluris]|uniref:Uncharacterized protein n=1 Tax=Streptomyces telluris TaxID=2720021 RepID=A0A9X2LPW1_9ACTN|nr:hypothetical protein [Streptomyces telluris]MCQ8774907.1 hypothetical protein [Streptomyces telluris]NJP81724.1 hypothetical protein [Streptomyces telluris]
MPTTSSPAQDLQDLAAFWSLGEVRAPEVVDAACDALLAGLDSPALRSLAACTRAEADYDAPELLPTALGELGLTFYPRGSDAGREAVAHSLVRRMLAGEMTPQELASRIHRQFGHDLPLAERLAAFHDEYDILEYGDKTEEEVDAEVLAEAHRLAERSLT